MSWSPPGLAGAALLAAVPAAAAAILLVPFGIETRGRRLEDIAFAAREPKRRAVTIAGRSYPVVLPSWNDPRLHVSFTFIWLYVLGQVEFHFRLSFPQMLAPFLTAGVIEVAYELRRKKAFIWPASALLTGNGIAFIMRIPGTRHGDWWTFHGTWIYASVAAVAMLSKYLITWRGRHIFNPSNLALVACFLILGSGRSEPLQFWWGPISPALLVVLGVIVVGDLLILRRVGQLAVASLFWLTFAAGTGLLALSGHAFSANWHLGPVADGYFWKVLVTSPEVFIFLSFMITDPRTTPETARGRRIYAIAIGLLATLLIAPMQTEFAAKVALLGTLTIVCASRPLIILARERLAMPRLPRRRGTAAGLGLVSAAAFAGLVIVAGGPARAASPLASPAMAGPVEVSVQRTVGVVSLNHATAQRVAADAVADLRDAARAMSTRDAASLTRCSSGSYLADLRMKIISAKGKAITIPTYEVTNVTLRAKQAVGQAPPTVVATLSGDMTTLTYPAGSHTAQSGATIPFTHVFDLALSGGRFLIIDDGSTPKGATLSNTVSRANLSKGTAAFSQTKLVDVATKVGLGFRQGAFRYSMSYDPQAMMGGGVCWIDYNNDGWLDLFAVNSYADADLPSWEDHGGLPRSALFENQHGAFKNVSAASHADIQVKGTGCVAADLNGDGFTDLVVTTAHGIQLLWNNGDGTFTQAASASGINPAYDWYAGAAVADVNGDGRPDLFVAGYTNMLEPIKSSIAGFPTNYQGVRDLLYLNEGNTANGHAHFREVGVAAGLESSHFSHGLGATFTDVNGDGRPDLYVANDEDANQLYVNEPGGPLGFHFVNQASTLGVADHNAGMGVAEGDYNLDGRPDLFITNSRSQPHAAYASEAPVNGAPRYQSEISRFATALARKETVGWGDSWVDLSNDGTPDLVLTNGAIPVTNLKKDTEPMQVLENLGGGNLTNASGIIDQQHMPKIIGRGLAAADFDNDGRMGVAVNTIGGPLVLLRNTGPVGNWLDVALTGFHPDAVVTATLADGKRIVDELHAGSSYLSSEDPRAHFGLGDLTSVQTLSVRYPSGAVQTLHDVAGNRIVTIPRP
jgi:Na+-translocating ferredoxin:NAD+ oxidoreductase RnfD subunit